MCKAGNPLGTPPNLDPMVSTFSPNTATASVPATRTRIEAGIRRDTRAAMTMSASALTDRAVAAGDHVLAAWASAFILGRNSLGTDAMRRPKKSRI